MQAILHSIPTLAVAGIYCIWFHYRQWCCNRQQQLRQRVTLMLWVMAKGIR